MPESALDPWEEISRLRAEVRKLLADNETLSSELDHTQEMASTLRTDLDYATSLNAEAERIHDTLRDELKQAKLEFCDLAAELDALQSQMDEALDYLNGSREPGQPEYCASEPLAHSIEHRLEIESLWHQEVSDQLEDLAEVVGWEDALDEPGFAPHVRQHIAQLERERDHLRAEISRYIELAAILRDELERAKRAVCDLATEHDQLLGQRAALLELLSEIRPEIEMLREKCGYHFGGEPRCNDCQEYAHLDSWLDRTGHLSDLSPEVADGR